MGDPKHMEIDLHFSLCIRDQVIAEKVDVRHIYTIRITDSLSLNKCNCNLQMLNFIILERNSK